MINDLSAEAVLGLIALSPQLLEDVRSLIREEYYNCKMEPNVIIEMWEGDD